MYSDHFFTQPHGLVRFTILILPTEPNRNIRKMLIQPMSHKPILVETLKKNDIFFFLLLIYSLFFISKIYLCTIWNFI